MRLLLKHQWCFSFFWPPQKGINSLGWMNNGSPQLSLEFFQRSKYTYHGDWLHPCVYGSYAFEYWVSRVHLCKGDICFSQGNDKRNIQQNDHQVCVTTNYMHVHVNVDLTWHFKTTWCWGWGWVVRVGLLVLLCQFHPCSVCLAYSNLCSFKFTTLLDEFKMDL